MYMPVKGWLPMSFHTYVKYTGTNSADETRVNQGEMTCCQQRSSSKFQVCSVKQERQKLTQYITFLLVE